MKNHFDIEQLALQRKRYAHLSDDEWRWMLQQVEGRQRTADKLPTFAAMDDWWYPVRLSCEQCSSEQTARYKHSLLNQYLPSRGRMVDLTGGYGVDTLFMSAYFASCDYVEQNAELCRIMQHNALIGANKDTTITIHNTTAEDFLSSADLYDFIFLDPARRDSHGGKVFRLADCTPNIITLLPTLLSHLTADGHIMLKLSPMVDISQAVHELTNAYSIQWDVYVVAVKNEVKEVLLLTKKEQADRQITAIDLAEPEKALQIPKAPKDSKDPKDPKDFKDFVGAYLHEPNAAILKAGGYKVIAALFDVQKLDANTHIYVSDKAVEAFPGRVWQVKRIIRDRKDLPSDLTQANVLTRNYPLSPEQIKKKLHLRDGGTAYIIGARVCGKPMLFLADRVM